MKNQQSSFFNSKQQPNTPPHQMRSSNKIIDQTTLPKVHTYYILEQIKRKSSERYKSIKIRYSVSHQSNTSDIKNKNNSSFVKFEQKYADVLKQINYQKLTDQEIKKQNTKLKEVILSFDQQIDNMLKHSQPKIQKNLNKVVILSEKQIKKARIKTDGPTLIIAQNPLQYRKQIQSRQKANNQTILHICKNQYMKLKKRQKYITTNQHQQTPTSNTTSLIIANARRKQSLQSNILQTFDQILKTKKQNKKIQHKSKTIGQCIHNTDDYIQNMKRLQYQLQFQQNTKNKLLKKSQQVQENITQINKKLFKIKLQHDIAQQYLNKIIKNQKIEQENKQKIQQLKNKQYKKQVLIKTKQIQYNSKQYTYHNLLKKLDNIQQNIKNTDKQIDKMEIITRDMKNQIKNLQNKLEKIIIIKKIKNNDNKNGVMLLSNQFGDSEHDMKSQFSLLAQQGDNKQADFRGSKLMNNNTTPVRNIDKRIQMHKQQIDLNINQNNSTYKNQKHQVIKNGNDQEVSSIKQNQSKVQIKEYANINQQEKY